MQQINEALFFSIAKQDYENAKKLLESGANPNAIFEIEKGKFMSTFNLLIKQTATIGYKKGPDNSTYKANMDLVKLASKTATLECKSLKEEKCPLYIAL